MKNYFTIIFLMISFSCFLGAEEINSSLQVQIENPRDYAILEAFFRQGIEKEEDYGYVLEGIKPISIRHFQSLDGFRNPKYLEWELLVHEAIPIWQRVCRRRGNYVFKTVSDKESIASGFELQFINICRLREVIEKNLSLFKYVLGPLLTTEQLIERIAYSNDPLDVVLNDNTTLIGVVLGYGLHNSLMEAKREMLSALILTEDQPPFLPVVASKQKSIMPEEMRRLYFLDYAGGDKSAFKEKKPAFPSVWELSDANEELQAYLDHEEALPISLQKEKPRFVFNAFTGGKSNEPLFRRLLEAQHCIQSLLKEEAFLETVIEKITGEKPLITCSKSSSKELFLHKEKEWQNILSTMAQKFDREGRTSFLKAFCQPTEHSRKRPWAIGVTNATLAGLKKAKSNLVKAEKKFSQWIDRSEIKEVYKGGLYVETTKKGHGKEITPAMNRIRVSYIVQDHNGTILSAKHDAWMLLRETIPGFAQGLQGMLLGEKRTLYMHPAISYGAMSTLPPCSALIIKVHLLEMDEEALCTKALPEIKLIDLDWINDAAFYQQVEESLHQIPCYIGSFYRDWLEKESGLDMKILAYFLQNKEVKTSAKGK